VLFAFFSRFGFLCRASDIDLLVISLHFIMNAFSILKELSWTVPGLFLASVLYPVLLGIYRIYFSPLRKIPGPKLSIATAWVEVWYDVVKGGQFTFAIEKWHQQYGS